MSFGDDCWSHKVLYDYGNEGEKSSYWTMSWAMFASSVI